MLWVLIRVSLYGVGTHYKCETILMSIHISSWRSKKYQYSLAEKDILFSSFGQMALMRLNLQFTYAQTP